jgi:hypothetical protein
LTFDIPKFKFPNGLKTKKLQMGYFESNISVGENTQKIIADSKSCEHCRDFGT